MMDVHRTWGEVFGYTHKVSADFPLYTWCSVCLEDARLKMSRPLPVSLDADAVDCLRCIEVMAQDVSHEMGELAPGETRVVDTYIQGDKFIVELEHMSVPTVDFITFQVTNDIPPEES